MPIVWLGRLLGIPIKHRIAGADIFDRLKSKKAAGNKLKVFLFGGEEGIAAAACRKLNAESGNKHELRWFLIIPASVLSMT